MVFAFGLVGGLADSLVEGMAVLIMMGQLTLIIK